jgi:diguanylate cyclase (GGDEF)-like protein/PAS domain S-box-containing protein
LIVALAVGAVGEHGFRLEQERIRQDQRNHTLSALGRFRAALEGELNATLYLTNGLVAYVATHSTLESEAVVPMLKTLYEQGRHLRNIGLAPGNRLTYVYPLEGNEKAVGLYYPDVPEQWPAVKRAIEERRPRLAGPVHLKQGGIGFIYRVPVFLGQNGPYWGLLSTVIDQESLFSRAGLAPRVDGLELALRGTDGAGAAGETFMGDAVLFNTDAVTAVVNTPSGTWELAARPTGGWTAGERVAWLRVGAWAMALLLGFATYYALAIQAAKAAVLERLAAGEEKLRGLFELSPLGIALTDMRGHHIEFNEAFRAICGYPADELRTLDHWALTPRKYEAEEARALESLQRTGYYGPYEKEYIRKDGRAVPLRLNSMRITGTDGQEYIWSIVEDVADRKRIEADLRVAATAFEAQVGILVADPDGVILRVNRAFTEGTGYTAEEAIGQTPRLFKSGRHDAAFYAAMWESIRLRGVWQGEIWDRRKTGEIYPKWMTITAVKNDEGAITHYVSTQIDITERKAAEDEIKNLAFYDPLTTLPNRRLLRERLHLALVTSHRSQRQGALLFIDLDNFKTLNDTLGHDKGDLLLQEVAQRLTGSVREGDTVARLGGDEFVIMLEELSEHIAEAAAQAETVGEKVLAVLNEPFLLDGHDHHSTASIGVTLFGNHHEAIDELLKQADLAMYEAKAAGRNALRFFDPEMQAVVTAHAVLEKELRKGIRDEQLVLYYQPQIGTGGQCTGAEVLVRWLHPERGLVLPDEFIRLAEESRLIRPLGNWVLETASKQLAAWASRTDTAHLTLAVNVSVHQLREEDFVEQVQAVLERTGADPRKLKLELTESVLLTDTEDTVAKMTALKAMGVGFALDDFGTGYSSLSYLKRLPLEKLKIDRSFVMDVLTDPNDAAIARTIVALAQGLGLAVIAEGVETEDQREFLAQNGCHAFQGYLFSRPLPLAEFEEYLTTGKAALASPT